MDHSKLRDPHPSYCRISEPQSYGMNIESSYVMQEQAFHGSYRASYPGIHVPQPPGSGLDFAILDAFAQRSARGLHIQDVIKPEEVSPWVAAQQTAQQGQAAQCSLGGANTYARSELSAQHSNFEVDSGYESLRPSRASPPSVCLQQQAAGHALWALDRQTLTPGAGQFHDVPTVPNAGPPEIYGLVKSAGKAFLQPCPYAKCKGRQPKNQSDAKKHELTHTRPFRCTEGGCARKEGFGTENDLQRHRKTVHNLKPTVGAAAGYVCAECPVPDGAARKFWPRRDNFKAHVKRKHPAHDVEKLVELSEEATRPDDVQSVMNETLSVRSAMRSAIQSQVDPDENLYHAEAEQSLVPPSLSRRGSSQDQNGIPWPDCDIDEDTLFNMQGHQAYDSGPSASAEHHYLAGVEPLASGPQSFGCASYDQPHKRLKLSGEYTDQQMRYFSQFHGPYMPFANPGPDAASGSHDIAVALDPAHITPGQYQCLQCHKTKKRECDLKKHMKRHTRPYGCTFASCDKRFGSRNDWKRHESSQHSLPEMWNCTCIRGDGNNGAPPSLHLLDAWDDHPRGPKYVARDITELETGCNNFPVAREGHNYFWCGFCVKPISHQSPTESGWEGRFKHVGEHFDKDKYDSDDWVCFNHHEKKKGVTVKDQKKSRCRGDPDYGDAGLVVNTAMESAVDLDTSSAISWASMLSYGRYAMDNHQRL